MTGTMMLCTYCLTRKPWDREHFPSPYAKCHKCIRSESTASAEGETVSGP